MQRIYLKVCPPYLTAKSNGMSLYLLVLTLIKGFRNIEDDHPASLQKITDDDLANSISNYIEVIEIVKMSPYQSFFHCTKIKYHSFVGTSFVKLTRL